MKRACVFLFCVLPSIACAQSLDINLSSPTSGSAAGPYDFNKIVVNNQYGTTGDSDAYGLATRHANALRIEMTEGGSNVTGFQTPLYVRLNHVIGTSNIGTADHVAAVFVALSDKDASGKGLYAANVLSWAKSGAVHNHVVGLNAEVGRFTGASVNYVAGVRSQKWGEQLGAVSDAAFSTVAMSGSRFGDLMLLNEWNGEPTLATTASLMRSHSAMTIANGFNLANVTFTGNVLETPHSRLTGAGDLTLNKNSGSLPAPTFSGTALHVGGADQSPTRAYMDAFSDTAYHGSTLVLRKSGGTLANPAAVPAGHQLGAILWEGRDGSGFNANDAPAIIGYAGENFTTTAHGSGFLFRPVPNGGLNSVLAATILPSGGFGLGVSGSGLALSNGELGMTKVAVSGSAPGAAGAKFAVVCGTNTGTAKLVMYAGTSTTPTTIADNVGGGVAGC